MIQLKRAYEKPSHDDGERILVERLRPRGLTKERAAGGPVVEGGSPESGASSTSRTFVGPARSRTI